MNSIAKMMKTNNELPERLAAIGLRATSAAFNDVIGRATKSKWSALQLLEEVVRMEVEEKTARNLEYRSMTARLGRFKQITDFDWNWPKKIDRALIESALNLQFISENRNLVLLGSNGLGKTMIAKNIAYQALLAGHTVLFRTASEIISDLSCESSITRKNKLNLYGRVSLLCIDEVGYLSYDAAAADLLYEVVNRRYERGSIVITTNRAFKDWNAVFPHATSIATMLDRLMHHAEMTVIEGESFRIRESEAESAARRKKSR
ncbi:MAG TPA: ATP-binding protein [Acidobacteriota bacterium]|nr:ATP-binding protein [Acidobacteriota bacterium]